MRLRGKGTRPSAGCPPPLLASLPGQPRASHLDGQPSAHPHILDPVRSPGLSPKIRCRAPGTVMVLLVDFGPACLSPFWLGLYFVYPTVLYFGVRNSHLLRDVTKVSAPRFSVVLFLMPSGLPGPPQHDHPGCGQAPPSGLTHPNIRSHLAPGLAGQTCLAFSPRQVPSPHPPLLWRLCPLLRCPGSRVSPQPTRHLLAHAFAVGVGFATTTEPKSSLGQTPWNVPSCTQSGILQALTWLSGAQGCVFRSPMRPLPLEQYLPQSRHSINI